MQKQNESSNQQSKPGVEYNCSNCKDTGTTFVRKTVTDSFGKREKEFGERCECQNRKHLRKRFENAFIPEEFQEAKFNNYEQESDVQKALYEATLDYLKDVQSILNEKPKHNSLGFIAMFGESRIRQLQGADRSEAKRENNSFGLGKTHLQMAAAKWIMNKVKLRDILPNSSKKSKVERGCQVFCVSDIEFMDDLTQAKRANDEGKQLQELLYKAINADILIWDDIGKAKWSQTKEDFYYRIINDRDRFKRPIFFSSNEDSGTLSEKIGYAATSRLLGMCGKRLYKVKGEDYRLRKEF